ncbi:hypothetical protein [Couchioplanes caeruleus]|uniref:Uncharacterized protein n=2 Tax=Couchioplanes caeruleus TaxID=56438 RepID=A0A1K0FMR2_9ACTN|nr:hypothetical protein [Couchioplanes caeruleus]OJF14081.1 hypothetical protein BG844_11720 [Couchioplanes caeruleus subsp. caeruleus]ROP21279.1 hypothetical protein EDD30_7676 [Couchioplanes caeruleus]
MNKKHEELAGQYAKRIAVAAAGSGAGLLARKAAVGIGLAVGGPATALLAAVVSTVASAAVADAVSDLDES